MPYEKKSQPANGQEGTESGPPIILDDTAWVLEWASTKEPVEFKHKEWIEVNDLRIRKVPYLAICKYCDEDEDENEDAFLLCYCDEAWEVITSTNCKSIEEARTRAETDYRNISSQWIKMDTTEEQAKAAFYKGKSIFLFFGRLITNSVCTVIVAVDLCRYLLNPEIPPNLWRISICTIILLILNPLKRVISVSFMVCGVAGGVILVNVGMQLFDYQFFSTPLPLTSDEYLYRAGVSVCLLSISAFQIWRTRKKEARFIV